ncbi:MAG: hypothetical protein Q4F71_05460 [Paracoccus sp. (in: a-proteobacteria)]|nr:hypothetical protein [Paracoccus sp. (in: a-proteobacteria)]
MIALIRLLFFLLLAELVMYLLIRSYLRSVRREELEKEFDRRHPEIRGPSPERQRFIARSMRGFDRTIRSRLVGLVFVLPTIAVIAIVIAVNSN